MEETFDKINGVIKSVSGYSGGHLANPTYKEVIYKDTGHVETIEITYDATILTFEELLEIFGKILIHLIVMDNFVIKEKVTAL